MKVSLPSLLRQHTSQMQQARTWQSSLKQVAANKLTCAIGDDASKLSAFQTNLAGTRASLAGITTAEEAEAYDGDSELASISALLELQIIGRVNLVLKNDEDAESIPTLSMPGLLSSAACSLFGIRRLANR